MPIRLLRGLLAALWRKPDYRAPGAPKTAETPVKPGHDGSPEFLCIDPACNCAGSPGLRYRPKPDRT
jgi:hypothetical protein